jgi:hypothetical protein
LAGSFGAVGFSQPAGAGDSFSRLLVGIASIIGDKIPIPGKSGGRCIRASVFPYCDLPKEHTVRLRSHARIRELRRVNAKLNDTRAIAIPALP